MGRRCKYLPHPVVDVFAADRQCETGRFYLIAGWQTLMRAAGGAAAGQPVWQNALI
jgi:hypothetical protein